MSIVNPYASALQIDPQREAQELARLKSNPQKLAELGLAPNEDFSKLKADPVKYNRVLQYVKSSVYKNPAYGALAEGSGKAQFVEDQTGKEYGKTGSEYRAERAPILEQKYGVAPLRERSQQLEAGSYGMTPNLTEKIKKEGGYDVEGLKDSFKQIQAEYVNAYRQFVNKEITNAQYADIVSRLSTAARSLEKAQTGLKDEVTRAEGNYKTMQANAKNAYENANNAYTSALDAEESGYKERRTEKRKLAEDTYADAKDIIDDGLKAEEKYRNSKGQIYNPYTGKWENKPGSGDGDVKSFYAEAQKLRSDLQSGKMEWGQAWNLMAQRFPKLKKDIDGALGGSGGYDEKSGKFDQTKATGYGKIGPRGADNKNASREKAYTDLDTDVSQFLKDNPEADGAELLNLAIQNYPELNITEIKSFLEAKGVIF